MVRLGGTMTVHTGRLQPLLVGVAVRQSLTPTARAQAALAGGAGGTAPTWRAALAGLPPGPHAPPAGAAD
jgi:hypothetical protein